MLSEVRPDDAVVSKLPESHLRKESFQEVCANIISKLTISESLDQGFDLMQRALLEVRHPVVLSFLNAHGFNLCFKDQSFYQSVLASDFVFRDGVGLKILFGLIGKDAGENLNGTDFIPLLLQRLSPQKLALIGTTDAVLAVASKHPSIVRHNLVLRDHGFRSVAEYIEPLIQAKPAVVILGMGMPKQEELSILLKKRASETMLIINGGAILDFMGNKVPRAPSVVQKIGLEWAFRLAIEPRRLFKRYVIGNVVFLTRAVRSYYVLRIQSTTNKH